MKVLGVSPAHDSSVCLIENNKIVKFYKEERLSKKKRDRHPLLSIFKTLEDINEIDCFVYCTPYDDFYSEYFQAVSKKTKIKNGIDLSKKHHYQHASLAFYNSGFKSAAVIVVDRNGSRLLENSGSEAETIFIADYPCNFIEIYKSYSMNSIYAHKYIKEKLKELPNCEIECKSNYGITKVYESATTLIMQSVLENGKTMGLSAYGRKNNKFPKLFVDNTNIPLDHFFSNQEHFGDYATVYAEYSSKANISITEENFQFYADFAWQVQKQTQESICHLIQKTINKTGIKNICITGGYGLNVVSNSYILQTFPNINFYFEPIADDSGNSIGGAMLGHRMLTNDSEIQKLETTFFHGEWHNIDINGELCKIDDVVELLIQQNSVGLYYGKAEAGPRSLGHRSILFDPRNTEAKQLVNRVKQREWYRPFAASMLKEDAEKYFFISDYRNTEFMTVNFNATESAKKEIPGILHIDNTCRIQIVNDIKEPLYQILTEFKKKTGVGVLLNTSFNLAGMPLVETPEDALWTLNNSELDVLYFPEKNILVRNQRIN